MTPRLSAIFIGLAVITLAGCTAAPSVELQTSSSPELWDGFPDNLDKIKQEWTGDTLHVSTIRTDRSGWDIVTKSASVSIQGDRMRLCYPYIIDEEEKKLPALTASFWPVTFDFYIHGASKREYQIEVSKNCGS